MRVPQKVKSSVASSAVAMNYFSQQAGVEPDTTVLYHQAEFSEATDDIFLHLSGHTGLLGTFIAGSV